MKIYHYVTGILNPTKADVLGEIDEQYENDTNKTSVGEEQFSDSDEEEINENYQRKK